MERRKLAPQTSATRKESLTRRKQDAHNRTRFLLRRIRLPCTAGYSIFRLRVARTRTAGGSIS
jgi:hypothetical protein